MRGALAAPVLLALCLGACAAAKNYTDPNEPRYVTRYGRSTLPDETIRVVSFNVKFAEKVDEAIADFQDTPALRRRTSWRCRRWTPRAPSASPRRSG